MGKEEFKKVYEKQPWRTMIPVSSGYTDNDGKYHPPEQYINAAVDSSLSARILKDAHCKDCGWPVIDACCNHEFTQFKDAADWDWWQYCSNKGCENHDGKGIFQDQPDWVFQKDNK